MFNSIVFKFKRPTKISFYIQHCYHFFHLSLININREKKVLLSPRERSNLIAQFENSVMKASVEIVVSYLYTNNFSPFLVEKQ